MNKCVSLAFRNGVSWRKRHMICCWSVLLGHWYDRRYLHQNLREMRYYVSVLACCNFLAPNVCDNLFVFIFLLLNLPFVPQIVHFHVFGFTLVAIVALSVSSPHKHFGRNVRFKCCRQDSCWPLRINFASPSRSAEWIRKKCVRKSKIWFDDLAVFHVPTQACSQT